VIAMLAIGDGAKQTVLNRISAMGTNLLLIRPGPRTPCVGGAVASLAPEDAEAIAGRCPIVLAAVPELGGASPRVLAAPDSSKVRHRYLGDISHARQLAGCQRNIFHEPGCEKLCRGLRALPDRL